MPAIRFQPRYTVEDYLGWEGDWELWDGSPVAMSPSPGFAHGMAAAALAETLRAQMRETDACGNCFVAVEIDWRVNEHTVVRPDLSVVCGKRPDLHIMSAPALVAEFLSSATREKDLTAKKALYAKEGVRFYVIGSLVIRTPRSYSSPSDGRRGRELALHAGCVVSIDAARVFS